MKRSKILVAAFAAALTFTTGAALAADPAPKSGAGDVLKGVTSPKAAAKPKAEAKPEKVVPPETVIASVDGRNITQRELDLAVNAYLRGAAQKMGGSHSGGAMQPNDKIRADIINQMIDREILFGDVEKGTYEGLDKKVADEYEQAKSSFATQEEFTKALADDGLDEPGLKKLITRRYSLESYVEKVITPKIKITDEEAKAFYDKNPNYFKQEEMVKASHILVTTQSTDTPEVKLKAKQKAEDLLKKLQGGEDFEALAKSSSDCPSKEQGGDLGYFGKGRMVKPFEEAAFGLETGKLSGIVETQFGYHIIKVTDHKKADVVPFDSVKERIVGHLKDIQVSAEIKNKIEELKKTAKVVKK